MTAVFVGALNLLGTKWLASPAEPQSGRAKRESASLRRRREEEIRSTQSRARGGGANDDGFTEVSLCAELDLVPVPSGKKWRCFGRSLG